MGKAAFCHNIQNNKFGNSLNISYLLIIYIAIFVRFNFDFSMLVYCHVQITVFYLMKFLSIKNIYIYMFYVNFVQERMGTRKLNLFNQMINHCLWTKSKSHSICLTFYQDDDNHLLFHTVGNCGEIVLSLKRKACKFGFHLAHRLYRYSSNFVYLRIFLFWEFIV